MPLMARMPPYPTCRSKTSSNRLFIITSQISGDHGGIFAHFFRHAFGDLPTVIEHRHTVAQSHDELYVVLDQQHGDTAVAYGLQQRFKTCRLSGIPVSYTHLRAHETRHDL